MLRNAELSSGTKPNLHRAALFLFQAEPTPGRR
jgi:hypothetical protein